MINYFNILNSPINFNNNLETCRKIITQDNFKFVQALIQILTLYYDIESNYHYSVKEQYSDSLSLLASDDGQNFYTTAQVELLHNKLNITVENNTITIDSEDGVYGPYQYIKQQNGIMPVDGWPNELGIHGVIPEQSGSLYIKIKYPANKIAQILSDNNNVFLCLEDNNNLSIFQNADTPLEKIAIVAKTIVDSFNKFK